MTTVFMNPTQRLRGAQGNIRKHKIGKCSLPPQHGCLWCCSSTEVGPGSCKRRLCRERDHLWGSALGTGLGYSLHCCTIFILCIIYCGEVSKQICHHIMGHRDPWKNIVSISGEAVTPLFRKSKWGTSVPSAPCLGRLERRGDGGIQHSPSLIPLSALPFQCVRACGHSRKPNWKSVLSSN